MSVEIGPRPITEVAKELGLSANELEPYGNDKAKVKTGAASASALNSKMAGSSSSSSSSAGGGAKSKSEGRRAAAAGERAQDKVVGRDGDRVHFELSLLPCLFGFASDTRWDASKKGARRIAYLGSAEYTIDVHEFTEVDVVEEFCNRTAGKRPVNEYIATNKVGHVPWQGGHTALRLNFVETANAEHQELLQIMQR